MSTCFQRSDLSILHIGGGRYNPEDKSHATFEIWRQLAKGFRRYTVVGRSTLPKYAKFVDGDVNVHLLASWIKSEGEFLFTQFQAESIASEVAAKVIITQCPVLGGLVAARAAKRYRAKILMEFHMAHYFDYKPLMSRHGILEALTRKNLVNADRIRVLSKSMGEKLMAKYGAEYESRIVVLPPRVDLSRFSHVKHEWCIKERPKVVVVGSVNQRKGQLRFLKAVLPSKIDVEIWIVGTGPELGACRSFAEQVGAGGRVKIFGQLNHSELAELLPKADVMVLFSNMEGTPRVLMEGMAVGLPIITTDAGFCSDVLDDGVQGLILKGDPTLEIVVCLKELLADELLRARIGQAARFRAEMDFDANKLYSQYRSLIKETAEA